MVGKIDRKITIQVLLIVGLLLTAIGVLYLIGGLTPSETSRRVTFEVKASGGYALISLRTPKESILDSKIVTTPWRKELKLTAGDEVYLTASNPSETGQISCEIIVENESWKLDKKVTPKNGVACGGILP